MSNDYELTRVKRSWCPEWAWWLFTRIRLPWIGQFVLHQPFKWALTRRPGTERATLDASKLKRVGRAPRCLRCSVFMLPVNGPAPYEDLCRCAQCGAEADLIGGDDA